MREEEALTERRRGYGVKSDLTFDEVVIHD